MERLCASDVRAILRFVGDTYAAPAGSFRLDTIARLRALVPSDMTAWVETRVGRPEVEAVASPHDLLPDGPRRFALVRDEHPVLLHFERSRHGGAAKLSDFLGERRYHRTRIYQEFFRPAGVEHQMSIALPSTGPRLTRLTLNRARGDFSERDRLVLNLVRPHVAQARENAEVVERLAAERRGLEQAADAVDVGVVIVRKGRAAYANARARGSSPPSSSRPDTCPTRWSSGSARPGGPPGRTTCRVHGPRSTSSGTAPGSRSGPFPDADGHLLVLRERLTRIAAGPLESLGLTRRQAEVLAWLVQGKANIDIAAILAISPRTVARHVEAIFERLGVRSRTAAAAAAFAHLASS